jgi:AcrR family transcriptional regulator
LTEAMQPEPAPLPRIFEPVTQRERLLDAMAQTVAGQGYMRTSVADVLTAARISRRTFYELFVDKEDCFLAAYDAIASVCEERVASAYHSERGWEDGIARALDAVLAALAAEPDFARLAVVEALAAGPRALDRRDATLRSFVRLVEHARGRADVAKAPPLLVAQAIAGGIYELVYSRIVRGETRTLTELQPELLHYALMLLGIEQNRV